MKKVIVNLLVTGFFFGMIFMVGTENVKANDTSVIRSGDYEYQILSVENKTAALRKVYNYGTEVVMPDSIDGYRIVIIGTNQTPIIEKDNVVSTDFEKAAIFAASDNTVKRLVIPEGVLQIADIAFNEMNALEELSLPRTLQSIGGNNFQNSTLLKEIDFPAGISVLNGSFRGAVFDRMILNGNFGGYDDDFGDMAGDAKQVIINDDNAHVTFGTTHIDKFVIGKKVKNIKLGPCNCENIVLRNPKTILDVFSSDECDIDKLSAVIAKDIKCKKRSDKYIYSWKPIKIKGKKYTVKYALSYRKSNGKFYKFRNIKKTSVKLDKKRKLRIEVKVQFKE